MDEHFITATEALAITKSTNDKIINSADYKYIMNSIREDIQIAAKRGSNFTKLYVQPIDIPTWFDKHVFMDHIFADLHKAGFATPTADDGSILIQW